MIHQLFDSVSLWLAMVSAVFAYLGLLAASRRGLSLLLGACVGAFTWFVGVIVLLVLGEARRDRRVGATSFRDGEDPFTVPAGRLAQPTWAGSDPFAVPAHPVSRVLGFATDDPFAMWGTQRAPTEPASTGPGSKLMLADHVQTGAFVAFAVPLLVSAFLPWGSGSVTSSRTHSHLDASVAPSDAAPVATAIVLSALTVLVVACLALRRPRGVWLAVALICASWWLWVITEWLISVDDVEDAAAALSSATGRAWSGQVSTDYGLWLAYVSSAGIVAVVVVATARLVGQRAHDAGGNLL